MQVRDLIAHLQSLDPEAEVVLAERGRDPLRVARAETVVMKRQRGSALLWGTAATGNEVEGVALRLSRVRRRRAAAPAEVTGPQPLDVDSLLKTA